MRERWTHGYTSGELESAQERYQLRFPPDLFDLLLDRRPVDGWDWRYDDAGIRRALSHPLDGLLFDLEHNDLWWPEWGKRPASAEERAEVLTAIVGAAPRLIPLIAHRYIPETPHEAGNPVFSVMQADVIYYGADLPEYFANEFGEPITLARRAASRSGPNWSSATGRLNVSNGWKADIGLATNPASRLGDELATNAPAGLTECGRQHGTSGVALGG